MQVLYRYVLEIPSPWTEEMARYLFIWSAFLAAAVSVGRNDQFSIPVLVEKLPSGPRRLLHIFIDLLQLTFALIMVRYGSLMAGRMMMARSPVLPIPQGAVYMVIPIAGAYMAVHLLCRLLFPACGSNGRDNRGPVRRHAILVRSRRADRDGAWTGGVGGDHTTRPCQPLVVIQRMFYGLDNFVILAVPLFMLLGEVMLAARITERLVEFAQAFVGRLPGGLGQVAVVSNMLMAGISGSGTADAAATGVVLVPAMTKAGYGRSLAAALVGCAATIGPIFPPSIIMIVYASVAGVSIARMFLAGVVPGLFMGVALMVIIGLKARRQGIGADGPPFSVRNAARATWRALPVLGMPVLVIGGILGGVFTPTESACVACLYGLFLGLVVYRTIRVRDLPRLFGAAALTTGKVSSFWRRRRRFPGSSPGPTRRASLRRCRFFRRAPRRG